MGCEELILPCEPWRAWAWAFLAGGRERDRDRQTDGPRPTHHKGSLGVLEPSLLLLVAHVLSVASLPQGAPPPGFGPRLGARGRTQASPAVPVKLRWGCGATASSGPCSVPQGQRTRVGSAGHAGARGAAPIPGQAQAPVAAWGLDTWPPGAEAPHACRAGRAVP